MYRILICDDEPELLGAMVDYFTHKGINVVSASNGKEAFELVEENEDFDLIILDVMMPVMNGFEACAEIKRIADTPVLFLTAKSQERDYLKGYSVGCDDYIAKPFPLSVLYEKSMALIRRYKGADMNNIITIDGISLSLDKQLLSVDSKQIPINNKDFNILKYLMENKNIVISRDLIITRIWGYDFDGDERIVDAHIKQIRKSLGEKAGHIKTVINVGYSFEEVVK